MLHKVLILWAALCNDRVGSGRAGPGRARAFQPVSCLQGCTNPASVALRPFSCSNRDVKPLGPVQGSVQTRRLNNGKFCYV